MANLFCVKDKVVIITGGAGILGKGIAWIFKPLGFGSWQASVATILGLLAKEQVVGTFGVLSSMANADLALEGDALTYACIANGGTYIEPKLYTKVVDHDGNVILDNTASETRQVFKETTAYLLTSAMSDTLIRGTGTAANFGGGMPAAGKFRRRRTDGGVRSHENHDSHPEHDPGG